MDKEKNYIVVFPDKSLQIYCNVIGKDCFQKGSKMFQVDLHESLENIRHFIFNSNCVPEQAGSFQYKIKQIW